MNWVLTRSQRRPDGIFSVLTDEFGNKLAVTLEHSFFNAPIIPKGTYQCVRGVHQLKNGIPFVTFEITGVQGHSGLLFHCGNFNGDSEGCILVGETFFTEPNADEMITNSRATFSKLMQLQTGVDSFELTVQG